MNNARVGLFEDEPAIRRLLTVRLERSGHSIIAAAGEPTEAQAIIDNLETMDVAVVDGNLTPESRNGADGAFLTGMLRYKFGESVKIVGFSARDEVAGADTQIVKPELDLLLEYIAGLPDSL